MSQYKLYILNSCLLRHLVFTSYYIVYKHNLLKRVPITVIQVHIDIITVYFLYTYLYIALRTSNEYY